MTIYSGKSDITSTLSTPPTERVLTELQLYGFRPFDGEPDPRPLPEAQIITGAVADIFDALVSTLSETRLEPDLIARLGDEEALETVAGNESERGFEKVEPPERRELVEHEE